MSVAAKQTIPVPQDMNIVPINDCYSVVGTTAVVITKPSGAQYIVLSADKGGWRVRPNDVHASMPASEFPAITNTSTAVGGVYIREGAGLVVTASVITVVGYNASSALSYWFL